MKQTHLAVGLVVIGVVVVATFLRDGIETFPKLPTSTQQNAAAEFEPVVGHATGAPAELLAALAESPETEVVMGIPVLKGRNCAVTRHYVDLGNGMVTEAYSCVPDKGTPDPYEQYGNEELAVMAYADARAASLLGKRLVDANPKQSRELLLRAVALEPANVEPVMWLASQSYSLRGDSKAARIATANAYVITSTARALGSDANVGWIVDDLKAAGFSDEGFAFLDRSVKDDLRAIRDIQLNVFGQSTIKEELL